MCIVRQAEHKDICSIAQIEAACFPPEEAASLGTFKKRFSLFPASFFVIECNGKVVGHTNGAIYSAPKLPDALYSNPKLHNPHGDYQTVFGLAVEPKQQNKGYATLLMKHFIDISRKNGRKGIVLTCKDNLIQFYESFGFVHQGVSNSSHGGARWNDMLLLF